MAEKSWLRDLIDRFLRWLRRAFIDGVQRIRDGAQIDLIARRLGAGDVEGAVRAIGIDPAKFRELSEVFNEAFIAAGKLTETRIPPKIDAAGFRLDVLFDVRNPRAETWLRDHSSKAIVQITEDQKAMARKVLTEGLAEGKNPKTIALDLAGRINRATGRREGGFIGLTATQQEWARNYARELATGDPAALLRKMRDKRFDRTIQKAIREGRGLTAKEATPIFRAYLNRMLLWRAETIARTETMTALHQGSMESVQQAIDAGQIPEGQVKKRWIGTLDRRIRDTHHSLHWQTVDFRADFVSPSGARLRYPGDPLAPPSEIVNCRCVLDFIGFNKVVSG